VRDLPGAHGRVGCSPTPRSDWPGGSCVALSCGDASTAPDLAWGPSAPRMPCIHRRRLRRRRDWTDRGDRPRSWRGVSRAVAHVNRPVTASSARAVERRSVMPRLGRISQTRCPQSPRCAVRGWNRPALRRLELPQDMSPPRAVTRPRWDRRAACFACEFRTGRLPEPFGRLAGVDGWAWRGRDPVRVACVDRQAVAACGAVRMRRVVKSRFALP
jgi:hypothetical protein